MAVSSISQLLPSRTALLHFKSCFVGQVLLCCGTSVWAIALLLLPRLCSLPCVLDARAWQQQQMEVHEEYKVKISQRTTGLYFQHGPGFCCPIMEIRGIICLEEELFLHKQPLANNTEKMLINSNGWQNRQQTSDLSILLHKLKQEGVWCWWQSLLWVTLAKSFREQLNSKLKKVGLFFPTGN